MIVGHFQEKVGKCRNTRKSSDKNLGKVVKKWDYWCKKVGIVGFFQVQNLSQ